MLIFLHGLESSGRGSKASFLRSLYPDIITPDFSGSLGERLGELHNILAGKKQIKLIGSSFGGLMATVFATEKKHCVDRLVLLAPALNFPEFKRYAIRPLDIPAWMIIGSRDIVTPPWQVAPVAQRIFRSLRYQEVDDDHLLAGTFRQLDWPKMLGE